MCVCAGGCVCAVCVCGLCACECVCVYVCVSMLMCVWYVYVCVSGWDVRLLTSATHHDGESVIYDDMDLLFSFLLTMPCISQPFLLIHYPSTLHTPHQNLRIITKQFFCHSALHSQFVVPVGATSTCMCARDGDYSNIVVVAIRGQRY